MGYKLFQLRRALHRFVFTPYFGIRKFVNALLLFAQFGLLKNPRIVGYPLKLSFDPSSVCQLRCPLCPTGQGRTERSPGKMGFEQYKRIVDEMAPWLYEIDLNNWGEPFLNPRLVEMIAYAHRKRIRTSVNTNLNVPLGKKKAEELVRSGLDVLYVSMDGITQETYEKYRKGGKLAQVHSNIKAVSEAKKRLGKKNPRIEWQFLVMKHNEQELPMLERVKKELRVDKLVLGAVRSDMGKEIFTPDEKKIESLRAFLPKNQAYSRYDYNKKQRKLRKKRCPFLWFVSVVNWNGSVSPCCSNYNETLDFGNAFEEGFKAVWNNEKYRAAREAVASGRPKGLTVCDNCLETGFID
jgi:MoaA/NifB/PqqE/SkfB family radical SAM enzyme